MSQTADQSLHAFSHSNATNFSLVTMGRLISTPKIGPYCGMISMPIHPVHPWTHPTQHSKWHPDPLGHFSTIHINHQTSRPSRSTDTKCGKWPAPIGHLQSLLRYGLIITTITRNLSCPTQEKPLQAVMLDIKHHNYSPKNLICWQVCEAGAAAELTNSFINISIPINYQQLKIMIIKL